MIGRCAVANSAFSFEVIFVGMNSSGTKYPSGGYI